MKIVLDKKIPCGCRRLLLFIVLCLLCISCTDELRSGTAYVVEGEPATVTLSLTQQDMSVKTRAALSDDDANRINSLWVGIYYENDAEGKRTVKKFFKTGDTGFEVPGAEHQEVKLPTITTTSGKCHIVAVANYDSNYGISDDKDVMDNKSDAQPLVSLLENADTWEQFKSISSIRDPANVQMMSSNIVMCGVYYEGTEHSNKHWIEEDDNEKTYAILPGATTMTGSIHLRRLIAYNIFNIIPGPNVTVEPLSWQVFNNPSISYLHEQNGNSADVSQFFQNSTNDYYRKNHGISPVSLSFEYTDYTDATGGSDGKHSGKYYSFDFYQYENKQTAVEYEKKGDGDYVGINPETTKPYTDREREWKNPGETNGYVSNTGLYKSLCEENDKEEFKVGGKYTRNFASFVVLRAKVSYWIDANGEPTGEKTANARRISGEAVYTIHLGYCEGDDSAEKAKDFNCRRNTKYTYNVTINGVDNIVVEAKTDGENEPGAEGIVTDTEGYYELDSHYCVFNIRLTDEERKNLSWMIQAPYDNEVVELSSLKNSETLHLEEWEKKFYNWIEFRPTTDERVLAPYALTDEEGKILPTWTLEDLRDVEKHPWVEYQFTKSDYYGTEKGYVTAMPKEKADDANDNTTKRWYTVFVNEYVYEDNDNETGSNWYKYVNKGDRLVWLNVNKPNTDNQYISSDRESIYSNNTKYLISQKSIQTYVNDRKQDDENLAIIGIEHINESYGMNLVWTDNNSTKNANGRYILWNYINNGRQAWANFSAQSKSVPTANGTQIVQTVAQLTPEIKKQQENQEALIRPVWQQSGWNGSPNAYDPNDTKIVHEAIASCMNRNRDLNGNGLIDLDEVRWFLPTTEMYARIYLGSSSLRSPMMNFYAVDALEYSANQWPYNSYNSRFHFITANKEIVWAEEGLSLTQNTNYESHPYAWEIRCVRLMGINLDKMEEDRQMEVVYEHDETNRTFTFTYLDEASIRSSTTSPLLVHKINDNLNRVPRKFEYAKEDDIVILANKEIGVGSSKDNNAVWKNYLAKNNPCAKLGSGWRVPNQKELIYMRRAGLLPESHTDKDGKSFRNKEQDYLTCTQCFFGDKDMLRFMGVTPYQAEAMKGQWENQENHPIRCVRDVIE